MALTRYFNTKRYKDDLGKAYVTNSDASYKVYRAIEAGTITYTTHILETGERLDYLSGLYYKDSSFWWVIAAASGIGYALQVPPRTVLRIPQNISEVLGVLS
tara:strand:- start:3093 stop:3398 length:306 start_codon:yes stop_codon:yes gene_type:complete